MIARVAVAAADSLAVCVCGTCTRVCGRSLPPYLTPPVLACKCGRKAPLVTSQVLFRNTMGGKIALMEKG